MVGEAELAGGCWESRRAGAAEAHAVFSFSLGIQAEARASHPGPQGAEVPHSELARPLAAAQRHGRLGPSALCW